MTLHTTPTMTGLFMLSPAPTRINQNNVPNYMFIAVHCTNAVREPVQCNTYIAVLVWTEPDSKTKICIYSCLLQGLPGCPIFSFQICKINATQYLHWLYDSCLSIMSKYGERTQHSQHEENPSWVKSWPWKDHNLEKEFTFLIMLSCILTSHSHTSFAPGKKP